MFDKSIEHAMNFAQSLYNGPKIPYNTLITPEKRRPAPWSFANAC